MWKKNEAGEIELDLRDLMMMLLSHIRLIILVTVLGALALFSYTYFFVTPMYTASTSLYVFNDKRSESITSSDLSVSKSLVDTYIVILQSDSFLSKVSQSIDADYTSNELRSMMSATAMNETEVFKVSVRHENPNEAQRIANAIAMVAPHEIIRVVKAGAVETIDYAALPTKAEWPLTCNTAIGALLGFVLTCLIVVVMGMLDTVIYTEADLEAGYTLPILGTIPYIEPMPTESKPKYGETAASKKGGDSE